jgi:hypothetical protein
MARKRRDKDEVSEDSKAGKSSKSKRASHEPEPEEAQAPRSRRGRKLFFLVALAGTATYLVRRSQRKAELDEGIWHEAPAPPGQPSAATGSAAPASPTTTA